MRHCSSHFLRKMLCLPLLAVLPVIVVAQDSLNKPILSNGEPPIFVEATAETISLVDKDSVSELIQERYANGAVKIERQLAQDEVGNFINHGSWKCWDPSGKLISEGQYEHGMREGEWVRYHHVKDSPLFKTAPYDKFEAPFVSVATFNLGELETIVSNNRCFFLDQKKNHPNHGQIPEGGHVFWSNSRRYTCLFLYGRSNSHCNKEGFSRYPVLSSGIALFCNAKNTRRNTIEGEKHP